MLSELRIDVGRAPSRDLRMVLPTRVKFDRSSADVQCCQNISRLHPKPPVGFSNR